MSRPDLTSGSYMYTDRDTRGIQCIGLWGLVLPPDIYLTRLGYLPHTLEWLIHQIPLNFELIDFQSGETVIGDSECDLERRGRSWLGVPICQLYP